MPLARTRVRPRRKIFEFGPRAVRSDTSTLTWRPNSTRVFGCALSRSPALMRWLV